MTDTARLSLHHAYALATRSSLSNGTSSDEHVRSASATIVGSGDGRGLGRFFVARFRDRQQTVVREGKQCADRRADDQLLPLCLGSVIGGRVALRAETGGADANAQPGSDRPGGRWAPRAGGQSDRFCPAASGRTPYDFGGAARTDIVLYRRASRPLSDGRWVTAQGVQLLGAPYVDILALSGPRAGGS